MTTSAAAFDWRTAPLSEAQRRLADLKRIYDHAVQVVSSRQDKRAVSYRCWTQTHKKEVPQSVIDQCKNNIADGRWVFRDDGAIDKDGSRYSIVCCSMLCHKVYQQWAIDNKFRRQQETR